MKKRSPDISSFVGIVLALGLVIFGIMAGTDADGNIIFSDQNFGSFIDIPSLLIVPGGTIGCLMLMYPLGIFMRVPKHLQVMYLPNMYQPEKYIETLVECGKKARISGLLSLEEDANTITDSFLKNSLQMIVDSVDPEIVKNQMEMWIDNIDARHETERGFWDKAAAVAPGFGMVGTLIGLINLMKTLDDIASVGPNMAVALVTTFYGSLMANAMLSPVAVKLKMRHDEEILCMSIVSKGIESIQAGENPTLIQETLLSMLPAYQQAKIAKKGGLSGGDGGGE